MVNVAMYLAAAVSQLFHGSIWFFIWYAVADGDLGNLYTFGTSIYITVVFVVTARIAGAYGEWTWIT